MTLLVAIRGWDENAWLDRFRRFLPEKDVVLAGSDIEPSTVTYVACWKHEPGSLAKFSNVKALFSLGAGVDHLITDLQLPPAPIVRMVDRDLTERMTEWVVWQCLDWLRQGKKYRAQQLASQWIDDRDQPAAHDICVGVMGLGVLGLDAIKMLKSLRFEVVGWSRSPKTIEDVQTFDGDDGLSAFLARTDILVVLLPLTHDTRGIINGTLLSKLSRKGRLGGPVLINAGRGGLQVEADILAALDDGTLKGASLDVFETEPLPVTSPLWSHSRIIITPHNSAMSEPDATAQAIVDQIRNFEKGLPLQNTVERMRGY
jgi:glyoxylate/hydroxypyruvate reductase